MPSVYEYSKEELSELLVDEPRYRTEQVWHGLWNEGQALEGITTIPKTLRAQLAERFPPSLEVANDVASDLGATRKWVFRLFDGATIETVLMAYEDRVTVCVSSQAGCAMGCTFCATGQAGFTRHLTAGEVLEQVMFAARAAAPRRLSNVVFMGMGEPLMNWKSVDTTLTILNDPRGLGIGARHITVSTVGWLPGIEALAARKEQFRLAISVHAPTDALRATLMPVNTKFPLGDVIDAAAAFDRRVTFEYVMLGGVNDTPAIATELAALARRCRAFVNLIPLHPGGAMGFVPTPREEIGAFARQLRSHGVEVAIRKSRGVDIAAACGQLRVERLQRRRPVPAD